MKVRDVLHVIAGTDKISYKTKLLKPIDVKSMTAREKHDFLRKNVYLIYPVSKREMLIIVYE